MARLKTNTAVTIALGPFVDATDGVTPETALTVASTAVTVVAETDDNSAPTLVLDSVAGDDATNTLAHITSDGAGYYSYKLTAANVNRLGRLTVCAIGAAHAPVFREFEIVPANVYDSHVLGTDKQQVDAVEISSATAAADNIETAYASTLAEETAVPAANAPVWTKLNFMFAKARNKITQTATTQVIRNDADSAAIATSTVSDDGTTYTRGEYV